MLVNAGVDVVIFDNSNEVTYDKARTAHPRVFTKDILVVARVMAKERLTPIMRRI